MLTYAKIGEQVVAELVSADVTLKTAQAAFDLMAEAYYQGAGCIICPQKTLAPEFFDLRTGLAGDILQKFSNYQMKLVIVGDFRTTTSESLGAFINESNRGKQVAFVNSKSEALQKIRQWS